MTKRVLLLALLLGLSPFAAAVAQETEATLHDETLASEIRRLNETLETISGLLVEQVEIQNLALLLERADLAASQAEAIEKELTRAKSQRQSLEDERHHLEMRRELIEAQLESGSMEAASAEIESFRAEIEAGLERIEIRQREIGAEIGELEGRLATKQLDLRDWQDLLDSRLAGR